MQNCPICSKKFSLTQIEQHVNDCLNNQDDFVMINSEPESVHISENTNFHHDADRELALKILAEEELQRKSEEEANQKLLVQLLEQEKMHEIERETYSCANCKKQKQIQEMFYLDSCVHMFCKFCLREMITSNVKNISCRNIACFDSTCKVPLSSRDIKELLDANEFLEYDRVSMQELIDTSSDMVKCPNCSYTIEKITSNHSAIDLKELGPDGKPLSPEAINHRNEFRFRCRECNTEFCASCKAVPYHLAFTCQQFKDYQQSKHCRFCGCQLNRASKSDTCNSEECTKKLALVCKKTKSCGHPCGGIANESSCLPCLLPECIEKNHDKSTNITQTGDDFCNICWTEDLNSAPCVRLDCGHIFHYECIKTKLVNKWSGARITFSFLECPLCKALITHNDPALKKILQPAMELYEVVKKKAVDRLEFVGLNQAKEITDPNSQFHKNPVKYALYRFSYFPCYKCQKPYFGGERACEAARADDFDPKELICGACVDPSKKSSCTIHGTEYIEYKCKFCCSPAIWFCWGTTHFCENCHKQATTIVKVPKENLPKCTCSIKHPPNGEEYCLGCSYCRILDQ
mmetsp:Transcript_18614/g.26102  ORF Transcript_18614/g.26102 Transcript_18614/m.26102 type:complete len:576 (+) Transcript_18614:22-1749(+)